jgi:putative heme-binding domain-containing protein
MPPICKSLFCLLATYLLLSGFNTSFSSAQQNSSSVRSTVALEAGKSTYTTSCAGCHGLDGRGSDKAANISGSAKVQHLSDAQLSGIISNGVPGTGMPAFRDLSEKQTRSLVSYLRLLQGKLERRNLPGDAGRGKQIFFGKGECSSCHTVSGEGGFLGPDLSVYGASVPADAIRDEIVRARRMPPQGYRLAVLVTSEGDRLEGVSRNEDNFSIQFQNKNGGFHLFQKSELRSIDRIETSLMPTDYRERLSPAELNDLASYLMTATPDASKAATPRKREDDFE